MSEKYFDALGSPELIEFCTNCTHNECTGECMDYKRKLNELRYGEDAKLWQRIKYTYKGRSLTAGEWAREYGLSVNRTRKLLRQGVPIEEVIEVAACKKKHIAVYEYKGEQKTIAGWANTVGLSSEALRRRLARGMTIEEALTTPRTAAGKKSRVDRGE